MNNIALVRQVSQIVQHMHDDGTLLSLSQHYYGLDFTTAARRFDIQVLGQLE